jgi:hypothetical protein
VKDVSSGNITGKSLIRIKPGVPKSSCSWFTVTYVVLLRLLHYQVFSISLLLLMITVGRRGFIS